MNFFQILFFSSLSCSLMFAMNNDDYILTKGELKAPTYSTLAYGKTTDFGRIFVKCQVKDENRYFSGYIKVFFEEGKNFDLGNDKNTEALWQTLKDEYTKLNNERNP